jgi:hypothetical protein
MGAHDWLQLTISYFYLNEIRSGGRQAKVGSPAQRFPPERLSGDCPCGRLAGLPGRHVCLLADLTAG